MKQFFKKGIFFALMTVTMVAIFMFSGCSGAATVKNMYSSQSYVREVSDFGTDWIYQSDYTLTVYSDDTYMLEYSSTASGTTDQASRGEQMTVYFGTYTSAVSAELGEGYTDFVLSTATRVIYYQHLQLGQYFGGEYYADTAAETWTDELIEVTECETSADYLTKKAKSFTVSVNDTSALITSIA